jgi:hypothetical protein
MRECQASGSYHFLIAEDWVEGANEVVIRYPIVCTVMGVTMTNRVRWSDSDARADM